MAKRRETTRKDNAMTKIEPRQKDKVDFKIREIRTIALQTDILLNLENRLRFNITSLI